MRSSRRTEVSLKSSAQQLADHSLSTELTTAWKSLSQSKAALRHIENRLEATPGTGVLLESVMDPPKKKSSKTVRHRGGQQADASGGSSKRRGRSQQSPEKSSSRSPLRNTTQDSNVLRNNSVEFREPLTSFREATPPPHPSSQLEAYSLQSVPGSSHPSSPPSSDPLLSQLVYQRDTRDKQTDKDLDSTHSSALESTEVRYLNDQPALVMLRSIGNHSRPTDVGTIEEDRTPKAQPGMESQESNPCGAPAPVSNHRGDSTPSSSPGSASQRLENLRRHQPDDKLEKLKERIRRQRQHLEEAAEREKLLGYLEQPIMAAVESNNTGTSNMPTAKIRKVAAAPPAPIYKGFNSTETKIRTPDGKVWNEEEFHNLSREIYRDLSRQFAETTRSRNQQLRDQRADRSKERRPPKPVRKVHRAAPSSDLNAKPVISPASWREGQKLVKMVLGPVPKPLREDRPQPADGLNRTASRHRSSSDPRSEEKSRSRPSSRERPHNGFQGQPKNRSTTTSTPSSADRERAPEVVGAELLSADIQGILDDLQLECREAERARQRSRAGSGGRRGRGGSGPQTRTPVSAWGTTVIKGSPSRGCRSASPTSHRPHTSNSADMAHKKRHYDADTVRQYILKQQEERKRRQAEEKRALREEGERRNQRLQELYRKQREVAKTVALASEVPVASVQQRLQETYNKLMEEVQLGEEATHTLPAAPAIQMRPMYQPSGESDKENKRLEAPQSPSSSDRSLNDQPAPPLSRTDLDVGVASLLQSDRLNPAFRPNTGPSSSSMQTPFGGPLLSQLLKLESAVAASDRLPAQQPATAPSIRPRSKLFRIEALKATAASLSNRIESEARKLAGEGINYGAATSMEGDTVLALRPSTAYVDDGCWAETAATENNDVGLRFQRILTSTGRSSYDGTVFPGAGNLHTLGGQKQTMGAHTNPTKPNTTSADFTGPILNSYTHERRKLVNGFEEVERKDKTAQRRGYGLMEDKNRTDLHDSSAGSISEGPLLSEGSFSEDETSPPRPSNNGVPKPADRLTAVDYCVGQRKDFKRISEFQREAASCLALSSPFVQHEGSKAAWEELNKGSPLSVINIYTKNLHSQPNVMGRNSERTSPSAQALHLGNGSVDAAVYEDDFVSSSHSSGHSGQLKRGSNSHSVNTHFEELMRRSPYEKNTGGINSNHSSFHSSNHSPHLSSGSASISSPFSKHSSKKRGTASDQSDGTLVGEQRSSCSPPSDALSSDSRKRGSDKSSAHSQARSVHHNDTLGETFQQSLEVDGKKSSAAAPKHASPRSSPDSSSPSGANSPSEAVRSGSLGANNPNTGTKTHSSRAETRTTGQLQYSPAVLQQRMAAELHYLESIEESVRHLNDMERLMGVSMAQQESVSLAQMLKAKQQSHEHDLYELKIKAEREALEAQLHLEENRQRAARAHIELQESLAGAQKDTLEGLQEATTKMMSQQAEAARYTAETARHIKEMTEMARSQIAGALVVPPVVTNSSKKEQQSPSQHRQDESDSFQSQVSSRKSGPEESLSPLNSLSHSDSLSFKRPHLSGADSSCHQSLSHGSSDQTERMKKGAVEGKQRQRGAEEREAASSSIEEEVLTAANDSLCSDSIHSVNEKGDSTSVATEYSLKFDESMTEDEIEERSFRSLLPSEAHRRGTKEKKSQHHEESEDDGANHSKTLISGEHNILKDANMAFSGGQDSFSQFTMDMVRQYMKDEEVRLQHQSSLLHLRQKALKEKTKTELAWLEHQKRRLRDKGEDDKMPPIRKKQRGLLLKLQQEQAEIKRLQEANKAARKERQLLLKQQKEIERMRNSTLRLKERLKCAGGEAPPETSVSETPLSEAASANIRHAEDGRSPSPPISISGSETSSIMQKLKKMRSHTDEKFLTKREQQLMQRRHHAEELLKWKQRLDQEEAEVRRMEKEAMAVWDRNTLKSEKDEMLDISPRQHQSSEPRTDSEKEYVSEGDISSVTPESSIHTEGPGSEQPGSPSLVQPLSASETPLASIQSSHANYTQDFTSASHSPHRQSAQTPSKGSHSPASSPSDGSSKTRMQLRSSSQTPNQACTQQSESPMAPQTELISDQSDIETRIKALTEELRKRKSMANQLKKEQKKRNKERLKAKEASLLKQLESYDNFIEKTKAELNKEPDSTLGSNSQIKDSASVAEQSSIKAAAHSSETSNISGSERRRIEASFENNYLPQPDDSRSTSVPEELSDEDPPTVTPTPVHGSPECPTLQSRSRFSTDKSLITPSPKEAQAQLNEAGGENIDLYQRSGKVSLQFEDQHSELHQQEKQDSMDSQWKLSKAKSSSISEEKLYSPSVTVEQDNQTKSRETSEAEQSNIIASSKSPSATMDLKTTAHLSPRSTSSNHSCSPDSFEFTSKKDVPIKDVEASSPIADGYHDDFESSVDSSPRGALPQISEIKALGKDSPSRATQYNSQSEEVEEEIAEDVSHQSGTSVASNQSGRLLDLGTCKKDSQNDNKDKVNSSLSPSMSPLVRDEMPSFNTGDRVLVSGVQPGTLRFKGPTSFAHGFWAGVELDKSEGSNNGTYEGVVYFECNESHGIFAPPDKITHLPDKFEIYTDTTEDEDSFFDDLSDKSGDKHKTSRDKTQNLKNKKEERNLKVSASGDKKVTDELVHKVESNLNSQNNKESEQLIPNGNTGYIMLDLEDAPTTLLISDMDKMGLTKQSQKITTSFEREDVDSPCQFTPADLSSDIIQDKDKEKDEYSLDMCADKLLNSFVKDAVEQFAVIKKAKEKKIQAANQLNGELFSEHAEEEEEWLPSVEQKDGLPFFLSAEKEELSSPELCNRMESPVLGASGQEELAKRLAELELSRELLDELGEDQDWFDEDYGLSSRREQQRLKQKQQEEEEEERLGRSGASAGAALGGLVSSPGGEQQVKTPPRPELPLHLPPKLPEQPAMVVPHSATEVEKMVHAAIQEIWETCGLGKEGALTLSQLPNPQPSQEYLGKKADSQDQEALSIRSYRKAVYDLTWEMLQEIYAEDSNTDQPQWVKPRRIKSSFFHRVRTAGEIAKVQEFITTEVLQLYSLTKDQCQKTDWQKMLKFGRKKRDRVDHILVQELHEEEAQWVNYDEDELFVKMQLADSIFDALLKDTANVLTLICEKRANVDTLS